jgi:Uma2 family endonuclease
MRNRAAHRFTVDTYDRMIEDGYLTKNDRVELIRGEIVAKMPIGRKHSAAVMRLNPLFQQTFGIQVLLSIQGPIVLEDSEPETDVALLKPRDDYYVEFKPRAEDVLLAIEVADSSVDDDRDVKGPLYAENGITEYWIVNLDEDCLEVYRSPRPNGTYRKKQILHRGDKVEAAAFKGTAFIVAELLGPRTK